MSGKILMLAGVSLAVLASPVWAQDSSDASNGLSEIVVTATKREQRLQDVPVAVTALGASAIENARINDFSGLTRAAASLTLTQAVASPNNSIILRGIGTFAFSIGVEPSVAVIVDDVPVVQQAQAFDDINDVERIEVLRGPQGTLFGKNASAGVVNIVTKDPGKDLAFSGQVMLTDDREVRIGGSISAPIGTGAGLRVSGYYGNYQGNVRNLATGNRLNDNESYGFRAKLKAELTPSISLTLTGGTARQSQGGAATTLRSVNLNYIPAGATVPVVPNFSGASILPSLIGITAGEANRLVRNDNDGPTSNRQTSIAGKLTADVGFADLVSVTSYQDWKYNFNADVDLTNLNVSGAGVPVTSPAGPAQGVNQGGPFHSTSFTQELRLVSTGTGPLKYVVGAYFADAATTRFFQRGPVLALANWEGYQSTRSLAAFAQLDYELPSGTTLTGGIRLNNERVKDYFVNYLPSATSYVSPASIGTCARGSAQCAGSNTDTVVTWKAAVRQKISEDVSAYVSVATGYKGYAYDLSTGYSPLRTANPVLPETSRSYELGLKSRFWDNKAQLNVAAFLANYDNFQAQSAQFIGAILQQKLNNVGKLRTQGVELELALQPTPWLHLDGSAAFTDAKIRSFPNASCSAGQLQTGTGCGPSTNPVGLGNVQNLSGSHLPNSPKFKFTLGSNVEVPVSANMKALFGVNFQHQSAVNFDLTGNPLLVQKAYELVGINAGIEVGSMRVTAFVSNLFDKHYVVGMNDFFGTYGTHTLFQVVPRDADRYAGVKIGYKF